MLRTLCFSTLGLLAMTVPSHAARIRISYPSYMEPYVLGTIGVAGVFMVLVWLTKPGDVSFAQLNHVRLDPVPNVLYRLMLTACVAMFGTLGYAVFLA